MKFIILIHGEEEWLRLSPSEMRAAVEKYRGWAGKLKDEGRLVDAAGLDDGCRSLSSAGGEVVVTDGPFAETIELVGGYYICTADSWEAAVEIAKECPTLSYGGNILLRREKTYA